MDLLTSILAWAVLAAIVGLGGGIIFMLVVAAIVADMARTKERNQRAVWDQVRPKR